MHENINILSMTNNDLETIKDILYSEFDDFWNFSVLKEELQNKNSKYVIATLNKEIIGFAGIKIIMDEAEIMNIVTKKTYRSKGVGTLLLNELISLCQKLKLNSVFLEVSESNSSAISLYQKFNFKTIGNRKNYYKESNAILMLKKLN